MKLMIEGKEIEIKVKGEFSERANKQDTLAFLNLVSIAFTESGEYWDKLAGRDCVTARVRKGYGTEIYKYCRDKGAYKNLD